MSRLKSLFVFVFMPILLSVSGEFVLKSAINGISSELGKGWGDLVVLLGSPGVVMGVGLIVLGGLLWIVTLSKFEMSFVYPFLSVNYVAVLVGSPMILGESVSWSRFVAMGFIVAGLIVISRSPNSRA